MFGNINIICFAEQKKKKGHGKRKGRKQEYIS